MIIIIIKTILTNLTLNQTRTQTSIPSTHTHARTHTWVGGRWCSSRAVVISGRATGILLRRSAKSLKIASALESMSERPSRGLRRTRLPAETELAEGSAPSWSGVPRGKVLMMSKKYK